MTTASKTGTNIIFVYKQKNIFSFKKDGPNEFLYGLDYVSKYYPCSFLFANKYKKFFFFNLLEKAIAQYSRLGIHFQTFLNNKNKIKKDDILITINDGLSFGLLFFKFFGKLNNKIIILIQGLHDRRQYFKWNIPLIFFYKKMLNKAECILALSTFEKELLVKLFNLEPNKVKVFYFGADINYWHSLPINHNQKTAEFVLSVGNDMHRDYDLLLDHYPLNIPLKLVTSRLGQKQLAIIKHNPLFINYQKISNDKLRQLYSLAKFVVIPLKKTFATSGLSVTLQALSMHKPVLLANAPAMQELFKDYEHVLYYQTNNPKSLKEKIIQLNNDINLRNKLAKNGRKIVEQKFNSKNMGKQLLKLIQQGHSWQS